MKLSKKQVQQILRKESELEETGVVSKKIQSSIEAEESLLGKELLIADQLRIVSFSKSDDQVLFYLLRLFKYNAQVQALLEVELENESLLLDKRIKKAFDNKKIHDEIYKNILKVANLHYKVGKKHLSNAKTKEGVDKEHVHLAIHHGDKAKDMFDTVLDKDIEKVIKRLALVKLEETYKMMLDRSFDLAKVLRKTISKVEKGKGVNLPVNEIRAMIAEQNLLLRHFAINYSKSLVHLAKYADSHMKPMVIYQHKP